MPYKAFVKNWNGDVNTDHRIFDTVESAQRFQVEEWRNGHFDPNDIKLHPAKFKTEETSEPATFSYPEFAKGKALFEYNRKIGRKSGKVLYEGFCNYVFFNEASFNAPVVHEVEKTSGSFWYIWYIWAYDIEEAYNIVQTELLKTLEGTYEGGGI